MQVNYNRKKDLEFIINSWSFFSGGLFFFHSPLNHLLYEFFLLRSTISTTTIAAIERIVFKWDSICTLGWVIHICSIFYISYQHIRIYPSYYNELSFPGKRNLNRNICFIHVRCFLDRFLDLTSYKFRDIIRLHVFIIIIVQWF